VLLIHLKGTIQGSRNLGQEWYPPVSRPAFRFGIKRLEAHTTLLREGIGKEQMEPGLGGWNLPSFPVQKANAKYRLVQDFRMLN